MCETAAGLEERLRNELELLEAMYPGCIAFDSRGRELKYSPTSEGNSLTKGVLVLRLPDHYPARGLPDIITAKDAKGLDARTQISSAFSELAIVEGEEALDAFILAFQDFVNESAGDSPPQDTVITRGEDKKEELRKTVVIWLHHLLNTNKRKLALSPGLDGGSVSGLTRPGYPGVMVFSGPKEAVDSHVAELRSQRWQAFQVRYDSEQDGSHGTGGDDDGCDDLAWVFEHSPGVREVESLGEMAQGIVRTEHRETFLRVMGLK